MATMCLVKDLSPSSGLCSLGLAGLTHMPDVRYLGHLGTGWSGGGQGAWLSWDDLLGSLRSPTP